MSSITTTFREKHPGIVSNETTSIKKRKLAETMLLAPDFEETYFDRLSLETFYHILHYLPSAKIEGVDVSRLALTSKRMSRLICHWLLSKNCISKVVRCMSSKHNAIHCYSNKCRQVALVAKRATLLETVSTRLNLIFQLSDKIQIAITRQLPALDLDMIFTIHGIILQKFIAGWDHSECIKVFRCVMMKKSYIQRSLQIFVSKTCGTDSANESLLRIYMRRLFLDFCPSDFDRAVWFGILHRYLKTANFAKLLILLYGPTNADGVIDWLFASNPRSYEHHVSNYAQLARAVGILQYVPNWSQSSSLEVLVYLSNCPSCWLLRSFSALLLPLSVINNDLVIEYFNILYRSGRSSTASLLIALIVMVSQRSLRFNVIGNDCSTALRVDAVPMNSASVYNLICSVVNSSFLNLERCVLLQQIWDGILDLADDFADSALTDGISSNAAHDFEELVSGWSELAATLMSEE